MDEKPPEFRNIYTAKDSEELADIYSEMADHYDSSLQTGWGWTIPDFTADVFARYVDHGSWILDAGAGTGLAGEALVKRGYRNIIGIDLTEAMLAQARAKDVYRKLHLMELGEPLAFPVDRFDAVISVGVMTMGHAPPRSLDELVRITKPGGHIVYTLRPDWYLLGGFREKHIVLEAGGQWEFLERTEPFVTRPQEGPDVVFEVWVFQVLD